MKEKKDRRKTCLQCDKPITQTEGRRERKFCPDSNCGQLYWLSTHPKENRFKRIPIEEYQKLMEKHLEVNRDEFKKSMNHIMETGIAITHTDTKGGVKAIHPFSEEGNKVRDMAAIEKQIAEYPKDFNSLLTLAKNGVEDKEGFKIWVKKRGLPPNQQSLIISKI